MEGDIWTSVVGKGHLEKEREEKTLSKGVLAPLVVAQVTYYCGMRATPKHVYTGRSLRDGYYPAWPCGRCRVNRDKAMARAKP